MIARSNRHHQWLAFMLSAAMALGLAIERAHADSRTAYCVLSRHDHTIALEKGPCQFSQRQGHVRVRLNWWSFRFEAGSAGKSYQRIASDQGLKFIRDGEYTLMVYWQEPASQTNHLSHE